MPEMETTRIILDKLPVKYVAAVRSRLGSYSADSMQIQRVGEELGYDIYRMTTQILAGKIASGTREFTFEFPATWRDHWKRDHATRWYARWIVRRWPARMTVHRNVIDFKQYAAYPLADLPVAPPDEFGYPVIWEMTQFRKPLDPGMRQVYRDNPRARFASRRVAERAVAEMIFQAVMDSSRGMGVNAAPQDIHVFFDALERLGVNVSQLITETAIESRGMPAEE